jgi:hypothetical protein
MLQEYNGSTMGFDHGDQDTSSSYDTILCEANDSSQE